MDGSSNRELSPQDTPDELLRLRMVLRGLPALKEKLGSVQVSETNRKCKEFIMDEFDTLEEAISSALAPVRTSYYLASQVTTFWLVGGQLLHDEKAQRQQSWHSSEVAGYLP